jgi:glycosyltransferase involved in cell wall biosynthesis
MDPATRQHWEGRRDELGLTESVRFTGEVTEAELVGLMRTASLVVFPSLYEGLGLPVLEARRCGAAVVCGDNSSLRELVLDPEARFDATDPSSIAETLSRFLTDPIARRDLAAQPVDPRYRWPVVAEAVVEVYRQLLEAPSRSVAHPRPRLAIASPVPPQLSGPSAYMAALLEHLPDHAEVTLFTTLPVERVQVDERVRVEPLATLEQVELLDGAFDEVLYMLGNSEFHIEQLAMLRRRPGAVLLHDARLTLLYSETYRRRPELLPGTFGDVLHTMYPGRYPTAMGGAQFLPMQEESRFGVLMIAEVARLATRLLVHSAHAADLIELDCGRRPEVIFPIPSPEVAEERAEPETPTVTSFGFASLAKCSDVVVEAAADLPDAQVVLVGHSGEDFLADLRGRAAELGADDRVTVTGKVDGAEYQRWLERTTVAVQLRLHSNGESSASVAETLAAGIPTVVTDLGTFSEYPDDVVVKVPVGVGPTELGRVLAELLADPDRRAALAGAGRRHARAHSYATAAATMVEVLCGSSRPARD